MNIDKTELKALALTVAELEDQPEKQEEHAEALDNLSTHLHCHTILGLIEEIEDITKLHGGSLGLPKEGWPAYHRRNMEKIAALITGQLERRINRRDSLLQRIATHLNEVGGIDKFAEELYGILVQEGKERPPVIDMSIGIAEFMSREKTFFDEWHSADTGLETGFHDTDHVIPDAAKPTPWDAWQARALRERRCGKSE